MQEEEILSAGIDIGTSTTQLIFSRMTLQNISGFGKIPQIKVVSKSIVYKSDIYFTPLLSQHEIDGEKVNEIIKKEYKKAGIRPEQLSTGAVIITGETSRKNNAREVVHAIADIAGEFVVATAGPDLESVLSGKGSGAYAISKENRCIVVNLDIGGGTTNICMFKDGEILGTACLDIGGRLIKIEKEKIVYISNKLRWLIDRLGLSITEGQTVNVDELKQLTDVMAHILAESIHLCAPGKYLAYMKTNHVLENSEIPDIVTFSGGVASCMQENTNKAIFRYGDIGVLLAESIKSCIDFKKVCRHNAKETMRATVIGAGNYSMSISGSTIEYTKEILPQKNLPVVKVLLETNEDIKNLSERIQKAYRLYNEKRGADAQLVLAMKGLKCPSFLQIQEIAGIIYKEYEKQMDTQKALILVLETDISKALGQAIRRLMKKKEYLICIDGIHCESGDFIDLLEPVASGTVIPAVVKTLIFQNTQ